MTDVDCKIELFYLGIFILLCSSIVLSEHNEYNFYDDDTLLPPYYSSTDQICSKIDGSVKKQGTVAYYYNDSNENPCWNIITNEVEIFTIRLPVFKSRFQTCMKLQIDEMSYSSNGVLSTSKPKTIYFSQTPFLSVFRAKQLKISLRSIGICYGEVKSYFYFDYKIESCISNIQLKTYEYITSPGYPSASLGNIMCSWNVSLSYKVDQFPIQFIVNTWRSDGSGAVYVYDGPDSTYPLLQVLNDEFNYNIEKQPITTSSQPSMYIKFIAGNTKGRPFNFTVKIKGYCLPGTRSCGDSENCYDEHLACDGQWDCANGNDEKGCETKGCSSNEYWCGRDTNACYYENQRCDGNVDCLTSQHDETNCDARSCAEGTFFCPSSKRCMYERRRCDRELYCPDSDTYQQCTYSASRRVITAGIVGSLVCGLLLAIALGCSCKLYALRSAAHMRSRRSRLILPTPLGRIARELLQQEAPPSYSMTVQGVEAGSGRESGRSRSSNSRRRRERRRRRNREPQIRRAQPCIPSVSVISSGQHQENICVDALPSTTESAASAQLVQSSEAPSNSSRSTAIDDDVVLLLAEIGLVDFPSESTNSVQSDCTAALSEVPSTSAVNVDQTYMSAETAPTEENSQAPPLPKKKQIKPVFVEAPYDTVIVGDIPGCVYPNPPTYTEAVTTPTSTPIAVSHSSSENSCVSSPDTSSSTHKKPFFKKLWSKHSSKNFWKLPNPIQNIFSVNSSSSSYQELDDTTESDSCISNDHSRCMDIVDDPTLLVSSPVVAISETAKQPSPSITDNSATSSCRQSSQQLDGAELIRSGNYVASRGLLELSETGQPSAGVCLQQVPEQNPVSVESSLSISTASSTFAHDHLLQVHHDGSSQFEKPL